MIRRKTVSEQRATLGTFGRGSGEIIRRGTWLYAGEVECDAQIVLCPICYGSGDLDDPPEFAEDILEPTYYLEFGSTTERGEFAASGGAYSTLEAALRSVAPYGVTWLEE